MKSSYNSYLFLRLEVLYNSVCPYVTMLVCLMIAKWKVALLSDVTKSDTKTSMYVNMNFFCIDHYCLDFKYCKTTLPGTCDLNRKTLQKQQF